MRMDHYIGLNDWARSLITRSIIEGTWIFYDKEGRSRASQTGAWNPVIVTEVGQFDGAFSGAPYQLLRYELPGGEAYTEFVQAEPWSSGPHFFLALRNGDGDVVPESLWSDEEIEDAT